MKRILVLAYGVVVYAIFFGVFLYSAGFIGDLIVPRTIDSPAGSNLWQAVLVNTLLLAAFSVLHSGMARQGFKTWLKQYIPAAAERSTYVMFSNIAFIALFLLWQPINIIVWDVQSATGSTILYSLFALGWVIVFVATCLINHFDLFGLRQVWLYFKGVEYTHLDFAQPWPYRMVRHPLYVGWITVVWAIPTMTVGHLFFALLVTAYILIAIQLEERDLISIHGEKYETYRKKVSMLIPKIF